MSLIDRASARPEPSVGGIPCQLGSAVAGLAEPLRTEAVDLILSEIASATVVDVLGDPDVAVIADIREIQRHRRRECKWCRREGVIT